MNQSKAPSIIKICGIKHIKTIIEMVSFPLTHIGFVFAKSSRQVSIDEAAQLSSILTQMNIRDKFKVVGVFVQPSFEELDLLLQQVDLDVIQFHELLEPEHCKKLMEKYQVAFWKVASITSIGKEYDEQLLIKECSPYVHIVQAILLDTYDPITFGGTGRTFKWDYIPPMINWTVENHLKLIVAGGLNEANVQQLIEKFDIDGVDVSSGVETNGTKDISKIKNFIEKVTHID